tara:strand:- start:167 stop:400 length:234 start_codon:yes stop_codon:yes gene_type:complete
MDEITFINNKQEMATYAKSDDNLGKWIIFRNVRYILIKCSEPVKSISLIQGTTREIPTKPSIWKDMNGFTINLEYCG